MNSPSLSSSKTNKGIEALAKLLPSATERREAVEVVENVAGPLEEMEPRTVQTLQTFRRVLEMPLREARPATDLSLVTTCAPMIDQAA